MPFPLFLRARVRPRGLLLRDACPSRENLVLAAGRVARATDLRGFRIRVTRSPFHSLDAKSRIDPGTPRNLWPLGRIDPGDPRRTREPNRETVGVFRVRARYFFFRIIVSRCFRLVVKLFPRDHATGRGPDDPHIITQFPAHAAFYLSRASREPSPSAGRGGFVVWHFGRCAAGCPASRHRRIAS